MAVLRPVLPPPDVALVEDGDVGDAVVAGQIIGASQPVAAGADDDDIVGRFELGGGRQVAARRVAAPEAVFQQAERHDLSRGPAALVSVVSNRGCWPSPMPTGGS